jgi:2'-5' RNA ligase
MKRLFFALPVPDLITKIFRESVRPFLDQLNEQGIQYRVPPHGNDHLTLAFLGPTDEAHEALAIQALQSLQGPAFELRWGVLDAFPSRRSARVAFAGFEPEEQLARLQGQLARSLRDSGFEVEKRAYVPHLTIARLARPSGLDRLVETGWYGQELPSLPVERVVLYESRPGPKGSAYIEVASVDLR